MTKHTLILFLTCVLTLGSLSASATIHSYATNSVLSSGTWVKIQVSETGVYKMTYEQLKQAGITSPEALRIYGYGGAQLEQNLTKPHIDDLCPVAFYMDKGSDNVFGSGDYVLFYGIGNIDWRYSRKRIEHTRNTYSDHGYYFLSCNAGQQVLISQEKDSLDANGANELTTYLELGLHEQDLVNLCDITGVEGGGRYFYGENLSSSSPTRSFSIEMHNLTGNMAQIVIPVAGSSTSSAIRFTLNYGTQSASVNTYPIGSSDFYTKATTDTIRTSMRPSSSGTQKLNISISSGQNGALGYIDYIELIAPAKLSMVGNQMKIQTTDGISSPVTNKYLLSNAKSNLQIWNVTHPNRISRMPAKMEGSVLTWLGSNQLELQKYVAVDPSGSNWHTPKVIGTIANQNLHSLVDIDYVIITPEAFKSQAERLAKLHESYNGLTTVVVTDQQIYNEFSSGTPDATAYRWLMKMLYDRAQDNAKIVPPSHLLLMGKGTFDNRKLLYNSGSNLLLTYQAVNSVLETQAYAADEYFGLLDDFNRGSEYYAKVRLGIGRLPVSNEEEAKGVVDKIEKYLQNPNYGNWKLQTVFLADDGDGVGKEFVHMSGADKCAKLFSSNNSDYIVNKIYTDAYNQETNATGEKYPVAQKQLEDLISSGVTLFDYMGHGGWNTIANEDLLNIKVIQSMTNKNQGVWMMGTCNFSHFDGGRVSAGEAAVLNPNGGAIGVLSSCRTVFADQNEKLNKAFLANLFKRTDACHFGNTIGLATMEAKLALSDISSNEQVNKFAYNLMGDPALRPKFPSDCKIVTTQMPDTIRSLSINEIKGEIRDCDGTLANWFNGIVDLTIYDKLQQITVIGIYNPDTFTTYNDYTNKIFNGTAEVVDGEFTIRFMVPKDIHYNYGNGRMVYYAYDPDEDKEASGSYDAFIIGGSNPVEILDTIGPDIRLYLNDSEFQDGGKTHEYPHFYAELQDESGINTVGSGIGHDLLLIIDNEPKQTYVLNQYYTSNAGSFTSGMVSYPMFEQTEGKHSLSFRAWDLMNNSSTKTLNYEVVKGLQTQIFSVVTYPNPVAANGTVHVKIHYDKPDATVETTMYIYDIRGQLVWTITQDNANDIEWNLSNMNITPGVYMYKVMLRTSENERYTTKAGKLIITQ